MVIICDAGVCNAGYYIVVQTRDGLKKKTTIIVPGSPCHAGFTFPSNAADRSRTGHSKRDMALLIAIRSAVICVLISEPFHHLGLPRR